MAFLDKLGDIAKNLGEMTNEAIETTKLNSKVSAERTAVGEVMKKIGEYYYEKYSSGAEVDEEVTQLCITIDEYNRNIAAAQAEIERIKAENEAAKKASVVEGSAVVMESTETDSVICDSCGARNSAGVKFCQECGSKLEAKQKRLCPSCGAEVADGIKFCGECGTRME